jgi:adenylyltransferase/sulfurtransferase
VVDDDTVSLSNLQRQIIHATPDVGRPKVECGGQDSRAQSACVIAHPSGAAECGNALDILDGYDVVVDGSDNFPTRYLVSDACYLARKTLVAGALGVFDASLTTIRAHDRNANGNLNPTYRCLFRKRRRPAPCRAARKPVYSARWRVYSAR